MSCKCEKSCRSLRAGWGVLVDENGKPIGKGRTLYRVSCYYCQTRTDDYDTKREAVIAWNAGNYAEFFHHSYNFI